MTSQHDARKTLKIFIAFLSSLCPKLTISNVPILFVCKLFTLSVRKLRTNPNVEQYRTGQGTIVCQPQHYHSSFVSFIAAIALLNKKTLFFYWQSIVYWFVQGVGRADQWIEYSSQKQLHHYLVTDTCQDDEQDDFETGWRYCSYTRGTEKNFYQKYFK